jgi:hypothetical protein
MKQFRKLAFILLTILAGCSSGKKYCDPDSIRSGRSSQHHDSKKFRGSIRIMWAKQFGNMCRVHYENMKQVVDKVYMNCNCKNVPVGTWVSVDSI